MKTGSLHAEESLKENALESLYGLRAEVIVEGDALWGRRTEEKTTEENEGERAHLGEARSERGRRGGGSRVLTSSVSADVANWAIASR